MKKVAANSDNGPTIVVANVVRKIAQEWSAEEDNWREFLKLSRALASMCRDLEKFVLDRAQRIEAIVRALRDTPEAVEMAYRGQNLNDHIFADHAANLLFDIEEGREEYSALFEEIRLSMEVHEAKSELCLRRILKMQALVGLALTDEELELQTVMQ